MWIVDIVLLCLACTGLGRRTQIKSDHTQGVKNPAVGWQASARQLSSLPLPTGLHSRHAAPELAVASKQELQYKAYDKLSRRKIAQLVELPGDAPEVAHMSNLTDLPDFKGPAFLIKQAYKSSRAVKPSLSKKINAKVKAQKHATQVIEAYYSGISKPLKSQLHNFRSIMRKLQPFQAELARLTWEASVRDGGKTIEALEKEVDLVRRSVIRVGKEATERASKASSIHEAKKIKEEAMDAVQATFEEGNKCHEKFIEMVHSLRRLPQPVQGDPMLVLVGMPNVGKSSLVSATSTGNPEINNYPFTTRRLKMGHVIGRSGARYQIMDTPGMLARAEEDRNPMEGLTLAAVEYLPSSVVYVMDMSGMSGEQSSPQLQLRVRDQVRALYPTRQWIDVRTKADLPLAKGVDPAMLPEGTLEVSVVDDTNIDVLRKRLAEMAGGDVEVDR